MKKEYDFDKMKGQKNPYSGETMAQDSYDNIPKATIAAIRKHADDGYDVGHFVTAVLENNLKEAINRADDSNIKCLRDIVRYCYWEITSICWGSPEKVAAWKELKQKEREGK